VCYEENFDKACRTFDADVTATVSALFRKGSADGKRKRSRTAHVRHNGSWFGGADKVPGLPIDRDVLKKSCRSTSRHCRPTDCPGPTPAA